MVSIEASLVPLKKEIRRELESKGIHVEEETLSEEIHSFMRDLADSILADAITNLNDQGITDTGVLANSGVVEPNDEGGFDVVFYAEHAEWVEYGTTAHPVSVEGQQAIEEWVSRKLRPLPEKNESQEKANRRVAQAIVWSIRKNGTDPHPFLIPAFEKHLSREGGR